MSDQVRLNETNDIYSYEEQLYDFEKSSYYKNVTQICTILKKYVDKIILYLQKFRYI